ncbi:MAG: ECF-type sigma factor [Planctomycetaceae bacterium]
MTAITAILADMRHGDSGAAQRLWPLVYDELRRLASQKLAAEKPGQTLQATALVHEAYLRMVGPRAAEGRRWDSRGHFFAAAAEAMRRILIEKARRGHARKRGGGFHRMSLEDAAALTQHEHEDDADLLALDEALTQFEVEDPDKALLVKLRYFAGLSMEEAARCLGVSLATAKRHWVYARARLYEQLQNGSPPAARPSTT